MMTSTQRNQSILDEIVSEERERHRRVDGSIDHDAAIPAIAARLTDDQIELFIERLRREAAADFAEADALEAHRQRKFGANDNGRPQ
jgi:hypothetical protein